MFAAHSSKETFLTWSLSQASENPRSLLVYIFPRAGEGG